jgi:hypothetical protein
MANSSSINEKILFFSVQNKYNIIDLKYNNTYLCKSKLKI